MSDIAVIVAYVALLTVVLFDLGVILGIVHR